jgi:transposase
MGKRAIIIINESLNELNILYKKTRKHKAKKKIKSLILTKEQKFRTRLELANYINVDEKTLYIWTKQYKDFGIQIMIKSTSGGRHNYKVSNEIRASLDEKLNDSTAPLQGYNDAVEWVKNKHNVEINYHTLRSFMITNFGTKLKQPRKSHYKKDEIAFEAFKKTSRTS